MPPFQFHAGGARARKAAPAAPEDLARGIGPRWLRLGLAVLAACYFAALLKRAPQRPGLHALTFFTEATCLFPGASTYAIEYRLEVWGCHDRTWRPLDPRPYFPIEADNKESRFQRIAYFYQRNRTVMRALDAWLVERHPEVEPAGAAPIGGIRVVKVVRPIPEPGAPVARYRYEPLAPIEPGERREIYWTKASERRERCGGG